MAGWPVRQVAVKHGVGPRSLGPAVGSHERPRLPAEQRVRTGEDDDTEPERREHFLRRHSAQTEEGERAVVRGCFQEVLKSFR